MSPLNLAAQAACGLLPSQPRGLRRSDATAVAPLAEPRPRHQAAQPPRVVDVVIENGDGEVAWRGQVLVPAPRYRAFFPVEGSR